MVIVFTDEDDQSWCDLCDAKLIERQDSSFICSNCGNTYNPGSTTKHKMDLQPEVKKYSNEGPEIFRMDNYANVTKKKEEVTAFEDKFFTAKKSGLSIIESVEYLPS